MKNGTRILVLVIGAVFVWTFAACGPSGDPAQKQQAMMDECEERLAACRADCEDSNDNDCLQRCELEFVECLEGIIDPPDPEQVDCDLFESMCLRICQDQGSFCVQVCEELTDLCRQQVDPDPSDCEEAFTECAWACDDDDENCWEHCRELLRQCVNQECEDRYHECLECEDDGDCQSEESCYEEYLVCIGEDPGPDPCDEEYRACVSECYLEDQECGEDLPCPGEYVCMPDLGGCVVPECFEECEAAHNQCINPQPDDCEVEYRRCAEGCVYLDLACEEHGECPEGFFCWPEAGGCVDSECNEECQQAYQQCVNPQPDDCERVFEQCLQDCTEDDPQCREYCEGVLRECQEG